MTKSSDPGHCLRRSATRFRRLAPPSFDLPPRFVARRTPRLVCCFFFKVGYVDSECAASRYTDSFLVFFSPDFIGIGREKELERRDEWPPTYRSLTKLIGAKTNNSPPPTLVTLTDENETENPRQRP